MWGILLLPLLPEGHQFQSYQKYDSIIDIRVSIIESYLSPLIFTRLKSNEQSRTSFYVFMPRLESTSPNYIPAEPLFRILIQHSRVLTNWMLERHTSS